MIILGVNAYHGDASAAIFRDGELVAAVEEERFTRIKHTAGFPSQAIRYCMEAAEVGPRDIDHVAVPRKRSAHILRKALWAARLPRMAASRSKVWRRFGDFKTTLAESVDSPVEILTARFHNIEHHVAHAASSFYASPFQEATVLSIDGLGDFASMLWGTGRDTKLDVGGFVLFPHSLGLFYSAITQYLGFWKYGDEYKVMGLAAYGEPRYGEEFERIVKADGGLKFRLGLEHFVHHRTGAQMTWTEGEPEQGKLFSEGLERALGPARKSDEPIEQRHRDVAATLQWRTEEVLFRLLNRLHDRTRIKTLCYAGGVAYNCVANGQIFDRTPFTDLYVQPAAGDAGLAIGAALDVNHRLLGNPRTFSMTHAYWGPGFSDDSARRALDDVEVSYREFQDDRSLCDHTAKRIAEGKVVGWFQGRAEWGPRALGNRSIVVDPRRADMKDLLNSRIKFREPFRPFSPSVLEEHVGEWFEMDYPSPFMLMAYPVRPEKKDLIPAPTHEDGTGRLQTVSKDSNPLYWQLIEAFNRLTGVPVLLNTSFNENEPIVNTPQQALACFLRTKMDVLVIGPFVVERDGTP